MFYLNYTNREKAYFPLPFQILSISMNSGPGHSRLSRILTSLIDIWDDAVWRSSVSETFLVGYNFDCFTHKLL